MNPAPSAANTRIPTVSHFPRHDDLRIEKLVDRLPGRAAATARWLRQPSSRWARVPAGAMLVGGAFLSILPLFGLWMLPLGLLLLAEDMPPLRRTRDRILDGLERRRPHWFSGTEGMRAPAPSSHTSSEAGEVSPEASHH